MACLNENYLKASEAGYLLSEFARRVREDCVDAIINQMPTRSP